MGKFLNLAVEAEPVVVDHDVDRDGIEQSAIELHADVCDVHAETDDIIETMQYTGSLSNIANNMAQGPETFSVESVRITHVMVDSILNRLGMRDSRPIPVMECFENHFERRMAYQIASEGLVESIVSIWRAIKRAILSVWERLKAFFHRMFDVTRKLEKWNNQLKDRLKNPGAYPLEDEFEHEEIARAFVINNRVRSDNVLTILNSHADITSDIKVLANNLATSSRLLNAVKDDYINKITDLKLLTAQNGEIPPSEHNLEQFELDLNEKIKIFRTDIINALHLQQSAEGNEGQIAESTTVLLEGKKIYLNSTKIGNSNYELDITFSDPESPGEIKLRVLTTEELRQVTIACDRLLKLQSLVNDAGNEVNKATRSLISIIESIERTIFDLNRTHKDTATIYMKSLEPVRQYVNSMIAVINRVYSTVPALNINAVRLALTYADESLTRYH